MKTIRCYQCDRYSSADLQDCAHCGAELVRYLEAPMAGGGFGPMEEVTASTRDFSRMRGYLPSKCVLWFVGAWLVGTLICYWIWGAGLTEFFNPWLAAALMSGGAVFCLMLYMTPWLFACAMERRQVVAIGMFNFLLGWTFLGWAIALVWACMEDRTEKGC